MVHTQRPEGSGNELAGVTWGGAEDRKGKEIPRFIIGWQEGVPAPALQPSSQTKPLPHSPSQPSKVSWQPQPFPTWHGLRQ